MLITKEVPAGKYVKHCFDNIVNVYGPPEVNVFDRDPRVSEINLEEAFLSDEQSEVTIRTQKNMLRSYIEERPNI